MEIIKWVCMVVLLAIVGVIDYRERIIPGRYLLLGLAIRLGFLLVEILQIRMMALEQFMLEFFFSIIVLIFTMLIRILSHEGLGLGDVKLLGLFPYYLDLHVMFQAVIIAVFIAFVQCVISKLKKKGDAIPFAPALFLGTLFAIHV